MLPKIFRSIYECMNKYSNKEIQFEVPSNKSIIKKTEAYLYLLTFKETVDINDFVFKFLKYYYTFYGSSERFHIEKVFTNLINSIKMADKLMNKPEVKFLNSGSNEDFKKGYLLNEDNYNS